MSVASAARAKKGAEQDIVQLSRPVSKIHARVTCARSAQSRLRDEISHRIRGRQHRGSIPFERRPV